MRRSIIVLLIVLSQIHRGCSKNCLGTGDGISFDEWIWSISWKISLHVLNALSYHLAYAQANRVNLLASNLNSLDKGVSGSGIYGAKGNIFSYSLPGTSTSKMLLSGGLNTPREDFVPFDLSLSKFNTSRVFEGNRYKFQALNLTSDSVVQQKVCYGLFCCQVNLTMGTEVNSSEVYQLMAYGGSLRLMDKTLPFVRICALLACESTDPRTCGNRAASSSTKFENISVTTDVCLGQKDFFQPLYLTTDLLPIYNTRYETTIKKYCTRLTLSTSREQKNVLAFGFYGSGGAMLNFSCFVVSFMVIVTYFI